MAAAAAALNLCGPAAAQRAGDTFQSPKAQSAYTQWRQLSQSEINCVDRALQARGTRLWASIQRGIAPGDASVAALRAGCRGQARAAATDQRRTDDAATKAAAAKAAAEAKAAADKAAAERAAAEMLAAEKAAAEKAAAERAAAAARNAAAEKAAVERITAEIAAAGKPATEGAAADAAEQHKAESRQAALLEPAANRPAAEKPPSSPPTPDAEPFKIAAIASWVGHRPAPQSMDEAAMAYAAAESRMSFIYGLVAGPLIFGFGGAMVLLFLRWRSRVAREATAATGWTFHRPGARKTA